MLSPPPADKTRPSGNGCVSAQGGEEIGVIYRALNAASPWKLKTEKSVSIIGYAAGVQQGKDANCGICEVVNYDTNSARRGLGDGCVRLN